MKNVTINNQYYVPKVFDKDVISRLMGLKSSKSADDVLAYIRDRRVKVEKSLDMYIETFNNKNWLYKFLNKRKLTDRINASTIIISELSSLEDYMTDFYTHINKTEWANRIYDKYAKSKID